MGWAKWGILIGSANFSAKHCNMLKKSWFVLVVAWCVWYTRGMKRQQHSDESICNVLRQHEAMTYDDAISYLNERYQEDYDPEGEREHIEYLEEREMESHIEHIRSQGGDYWRNDAGEWMCG